MSWWRGRNKAHELERLATLAGEASAEAAVALEAASTSTQLPTEPEIPAEDGEQDAAGAGGVPTEPDPAPAPPDLTAAAFFDVDNTMMMGASIFHFARGLAARKYVTASDLAGFAWQQVKFRVGGKENKESVSSAREQLLSFVAGRTVDEMVEVGEEIYDELMADKIWSGTRALAQMHLEAGQRVWLVTATPVELAAIIARRLGLTGALGTVAEHVDGVYTGRLVGDLLHGRAKAHAVRALAAREGLNLRRCAAYSDSQNDVPMLSVVGTAVAVNPDAGLREIARNRQWEIRDFRTGRKAAKIGVPSVLGAGALAGAVAAGLAYRKRTA
ncbi:HAD family hydrolase [Amycolatopsis aidingensis]|uniref:HAD family hydrolase n=1 Tax=Amycolatopsis aidingensis TaxID=2842453 RepID=UPI001C0C8A16|nr:HAD-IB family hydrolase [Amycolatopsis aidingensis]